VRVELHRPLSLRVLLRDKEGKPLPGGAVALGQDPRTLTWRDGFFQFAWVPLRDLGDGHYGAEGLASGWYMAAGGHPGHRPADAGWIGLRPGGPPVEIVLEPAAGIRGRVVDDTAGTPIAGARVWVMPFLFGEKLENTDPRNTREAGEALGAAAGTVTGPDGEFALLSASAGDPTLLWAVAEDHRPFGARVASLGKEPPFEIRMRPLDARDAMPVSVSLGAAGRVVLKPARDATERWIVVRDAAGAVPWSGLETSLPGVPGKGYVLVLPPGDYEFTLATGLARRDPRTARAVVRAGAESVVE
jgi:hypothetical protein